jgi:hypothetical protein
VHYTVDRVPEGQTWTHSTGFINEDMIRRALPAAAGPDAFVGMCVAQYMYPLYIYIYLYIYI